MTRAGSVLLLGVLAGCSSTSSMNPVNWWHGMQGGRIAEERPAPPGADSPYPNLSTVPARPAPPDRDAMKRLTESLIGDRSNAQYTAEAAPLADPSSPSASPGLFGAGTLPPPPPAPPPSSGPAPMSASLPAASAPPAPATPPSPAPLRPVQSQPLEAPPASVPPAAEVGAPPVPAASGSPAESVGGSATPPQAAASLSAPVSSTGVSSTGVSSTGVSSTGARAEPLPELPTAPPPRAAAAPPPPPPAAQPLPASPAAQGGVTLGFAPGSSQLSSTAADDVKRFLVGRVGQPIAVTGYGDATSADPAAQTAAVSLALTRAQAVVNALTTAGVPRTAISIGAEAGGRGASLRLLQ